MIEGSLHLEQQQTSVLTNGVFELGTYPSPLVSVPKLMHHLSVMDWNHQKIRSFRLSASSAFEADVHDANNPALKAQSVPYYPTVHAINQKKGLRDVFVCV